MWLKQRIGKQFAKKTKTKDTQILNQGRHSPRKNKRNQTENKPGTI